MFRKKILSWLWGGTFAFSTLMGLFLLLASEKVSLISGIVVICLSIASGLILPNPLCVFTLIAGICMTVLPPWTVGIVLLCIGLAGALVNFILWLKRYDFAKQSG